MKYLEHLTAEYFPVCPLSGILSSRRSNPSSKIWLNIRLICIRFTCFTKRNCSMNVPLLNVTDLYDILTLPL